MRPGGDFNNASRGAQCRSRGAAVTKRSNLNPWKPGQSGNPAGPKPGTSPGAKLRAAIANDLPDIIAKLVQQAKAGDATAARLLIERVLPPVKAAEQPVPIAMPADGTLAERGRAVLAATAAGALAPGQAAQMLSALGALGELVKTDELAARVAALEERNGDRP